MRLENEYHYLLGIVHKAPLLFDIHICTLLKLLLSYFETKYWNNVNLELDLQMANQDCQKSQAYFTFAETHSFLVRAKICSILIIKIKKNKCKFF